MKVILPAAGYATRMHPLTKDFPKALLDLHGRPIIEYPISRIQRAGFASGINVVVNNRDHKRFLEWGKTHPELEIRVINDGTNSDNERLGSVADVALALSSNDVEEDFAVVNPDNLFTFDLNDMYSDFLKRKKSVIALYDVKRIEQARKMGNPLVDVNKRIIGFQEKSPDPYSTVCTVGIYFFNKEIRQRIFEYLAWCDKRSGEGRDRFGDFIAWLFSREELYGHLYDSKNKWFDIGSVENYEKAKRLKDTDDFL